jgi:hypothetical protein
LTTKNDLSRTIDESFAKFLNEMDKDSKRAAEPAVLVMRKSLPQILDEMDANIRAAIEASLRAMEAAKAAGEAAEAAIKASDEVENRAEQARRAGEKAASEAVAASKEASKNTNKALSDSKAELLQYIKSLEERINKIEDTLPEEEIIILREISKDEAKREISKLFSKGKTLYYSDIAKQLGLNLKLVVEVCNELQKDKEIEVIDNSLQRR